MIPINSSPQTSSITTLRHLNKTIAATKSEPSDSVSIESGLGEIASSLADIHNTLSNASASEVTEQFLNENINTLRSLQSKMGEYDAAAGFTGSAADQLDALRLEVGAVISGMTQLSAINGAINGVEGIQDVIDTAEGRIDSLSQVSNYLSGQEKIDFDNALGALQAEVDGLEGLDNDEMLEGAIGVMDGLSALGEMVNGFSGLSQGIKDGFQGRVDYINTDIGELPTELIEQREALEAGVSEGLASVSSDLTDAANLVKKAYEALPEPELAPLEPTSTKIEGHHMVMGVAVKFSMLAEGGKASDLKLDVESVPFFEQMKQRPEDNIYLTRKEKTPLQKKIEEVRGGGFINWDRWENLAKQARSV